jgi:ribosomal protein S18 acetylase RimI-like enzyme
MHPFVRLAENSLPPVIGKMKAEERDDVLACFERNFGIDSRAIAGYFDDPRSRCFVVRSGDRVVGFYLLQDLQIEALFPQAAGKYHGRGIHGVALCLDPEYRASGIGRKMMAIPEASGADYVWGQHLHQLNNLEQWKKRRDHVLSDNEVHVTAKQF